MYYTLVHKEVLDGEHLIRGEELDERVDLSSYKHIIGVNDDTYIDNGIVIYPDLRILVWEDSPLLNIIWDEYRIVSYDEFNLIKKGHRSESEVGEINISEPYETLDRQPEYYKYYRKKNLSNRDEVSSNEEVEYLRQLGYPIKYRKRFDLFTMGLGECNSQPRKSWKFEKKKRQWL